MYFYALELVEIVIKILSKRFSLFPTLVNFAFWHTMEGAWS